MRRIDRQAMALVAVTLVVDQLSKQLLLSYLLKAGDVVPVIDDFFRLVIVWNRGVSFGLLGGDRALPAWLLSGVAIAVCVGLFVWLRRTDRPSPAGASALSWAGPSAMLSTARAGERCSISPIFTWSMALAGFQRRRFGDRASASG